MRSQRLEAAQKSRNSVPSGHLRVPARLLMAVALLLVAGCSNKSINQSVSFNKTHCPTTLMVGETDFISVSLTTDDTVRFRGKTLTFTSDDGGAVDISPFVPGEQVPDVWFTATAPGHVTLKYTVDLSTPGIDETVDEFFTKNAPCSFTITGSVPEPDTHILYVRKTADAGRTGLSWEEAFDTLQDALKLAKELDNDGDDDTFITEIRVAQGVYFPDEGALGAPPDPREATFSLPEDVKVIGGYDGEDANADDRDLLVFETILDGNAPSGRSYSVVEVREDNCTLDGFTIRNGLANDNEGTQGAEALGGGLFISGAENVLVKNCRFEQNEAVQGGALASDRRGLRVHRQLRGLGRWRRRVRTGSLRSRALHLHEQHRSGARRCGSRREHSLDQD